MSGMAVGWGWAQEPPTPWPGSPALRGVNTSAVRTVFIRGETIRVTAPVPVATAATARLAVALEYDRKVMDAPVVSAKGSGFLARKIREIAREKGVPVVENKPLARSLFENLEVGDEVPEEFYRAVAEVLAFVYRIRKGKTSAPPGPKMGASEGRDGQSAIFM